MRNRQVYCCIAAALFPLSIFAQPHAWTLRECEDYAVANNITIKQRAKAVEKQEHALSTARNSRLPDLSGSVGQNFSLPIRVTLRCSSRRVCPSSRGSRFQRTSS